MSAYLWLKLVHVLSAVVAVGSNLTYFVWLQRARAKPAPTVDILGGIQLIDRRLANPAYGLLAVTGITMVLVSDLGFSTFWIATAIVLYVLLVVFGGALSAQRCVGSSSWRRRGNPTLAPTPMRYGAPR